MLWRVVVDVKKPALGGLGVTVTVATYLRATKVKAKHRQQWRDAGYEFFKTEANGANVMIAGQKGGKPYYLCIDGAKVTAQ